MNKSFSLILASTLALAMTFILGCSEKCGEAKYDPEKQFCAEDKVYEKCGGNDYNPVEKICVDGKIAQRCGEKGYDPATHFCANMPFVGYVVYERCGGKEYKPAEQICIDGKAMQKCGEKGYDPAEQYCNNGTIAIFQKCKDIKYKPETQVCKNNKLYSNCGKNLYDAETQFCRGDKAITKCFGEEYNYEQYICVNGEFLMENGETVNVSIASHAKRLSPEPSGKGNCGASDAKKCGYCAADGMDDGNKYDKETEFCGKYAYSGGVDGFVLLKCGGKTYNAYSQYCKDGVVQTYKCAGKSFTLNYNFCLDDKLYRKCYGGEDTDDDGIYNPKTQGCCERPTENSDEPERRKYSLATHICEDGQVREK